MTDRRRKHRDWVTPALMTLSLHLLALTLFINHKLFSMMQQPASTGVTLKVSALVGDDPDDDQQQDDAGAAPGEPAQAQSAQPSVAEILRQTQDVVPAPLPAREYTRPQPESQPENSSEEAPADSMTLAQRLAQMRPAGGASGSGEASFTPGGGSHGLRGQGRSGEGLRRNGGSAETEDAVEMGLAWLAGVQDSDGRWDSDGYMGHYLPNASALQKGAEGMGLGRNDIGVTGLCLMAFTGAGYVHTGGRFAQTVRQAKDYLLANQRIEDGGFGLERDGNRPDMYGHVLATLGLCDLYLQSGDQKLRTPLKRALTYLLEMQGPGGGWDYAQRWPGAQANFKRTDRNDLSISGWAIMALVAAREAGFDVPRENLQRVKSMLAQATMNDGDGVYANTGVRADARGLAMLAVSNVSRRLMGESADSGIQQRQRERLARNAPDWHKAGDLLGSNEYAWYYGSLSMLLGRDTSGGDNRWREWNAALKRALIDNQCKSGPRKGSFDPVGHWARNGGGRLYMTALCVLNLEIYYRYEPEYLRVRAAELAWLWE
ncbi:MAG: hypothetical protein KF754_12400 [Planctomycetes bacterium]|nr:hypothetical protein [Planctomycetota bacterium]